METKFEEFNLLIKDHDDTLGTMMSQTRSRVQACGASTRTTSNASAVEQPVVRKFVQGYDRPSTNTSKVRKGFTVTDTRGDDPMDVDNVHRIRANKREPRRKRQGERQRTGQEMIPEHTQTLDKYNEKSKKTTRKSPNESCV